MIITSMRAYIQVKFKYLIYEECELTFLRTPLNDFDCLLSLAVL